MNACLSDFRVEPDAADIQRSRGAHCAIVYSL